MLSNIDWTKKELLILAFDHRGSFLKKLFGIDGRPPTEAEALLIADYKMAIYEGFRQALNLGVPQSMAGILVDEQFGSAIVQDAKRDAITFAMPCEKSGQDEFDFEYGEHFGEHIQKFQPSFTKVLVRYNPEDDPAMNTRQLQRLRRLGDYLGNNGHAFLFELLVPATKQQSDRLGNDTKRFDREMRPRLTVEAMMQIQAAGIEPDIWKLEGVDRPEESRALAYQAQADGRKAGVITLGRGESKERVQEWLRVGANIPGVIGFAVGRTIFWDPLKDWKDGKHDRAKAVERIAQNYYEFVQLWMDEKKKIGNQYG